MTVAGQTAGAAADNTFQAAANVPSGTSNVVVQATDQRGNVRTNTYQVTATGTPQTLIYDLNGNLCSEGGPTCTTGSKTYEWDAENRLIAVNSGTHRSEFTYDGEDRRVRIVEKENGVETSNRRYLWCGLEICEQRDGTGSTVQRRFYDQGFLEGTNKYFYAKDHLGSIRDTTDNAGSLQLRLEFDPYGRPNAPAGSQPPTWSTFGYTGHFIHWDSGVVAAPYRGYLSTYGRWISEDPIGLVGGVNYYAYVVNNPTAHLDPLGLQWWNPKNWWDAWKEVKKQKKCIEVAIDCDKRVQCKCDAQPHPNAGSRLSNCQAPGSTCCAKIVLLCEAGQSYDLNDCAPPVPPPPSPTPAPSPNPCNVYGQNSKQCLVWWEEWKKKNAGEW